MLHNHIDPAANQADNAIGRDHAEQKMGITFFAWMVPDVRYEIGKYLSDRDIQNLSRVSRALHGPIAQQEFRFEYDKDYKSKAAERAFNKCGKPIFKLMSKLDDSEDTAESAACGAGLAVASLPIACAAAAAAPIGLLAAIIEHHREKSAAKNAVKLFNKQIRPFEGNQLKFRR